MHDRQHNYFSLVSEIKEALHEIVAAPHFPTRKIKLIWDYTEYSQAQFFSQYRLLRTRCAKCEMMNCESIELFLRIDDDTCTYRMRNARRRGHYIARKAHKSINLKILNRLKLTPDVLARRDS